MTPPYPEKIVTQGQLHAFADAALAVTLAHYRANKYTHVLDNYDTVIEFTQGPRFAKFERIEISKKTKERFSRGVHCFVDLSNGDVLKAASWRTPAKGARGNLFDESKGTARLTPYGVEYNRR